MCAQSASTSSQRLVRVIVGAGLLVLSIAALLVLLQSEPRRAGTNRVSSRALAAGLPGGSELCQPGELLPGGTAALVLRADSGAHAAPALAIRITAAAGALSSGEVSAGWPSGALRIPLRRVTRTVSNATVCVRNLGTTQVAFAGASPDPGFQIDVAGVPQSGRLRIDYMRAGSESWLQFLPVLAERFSLAKADPLRHWELPAVLVLMTIALSAAVVTLLRVGET